MRSPADPETAAPPRLPEYATRARRDRSSIRSFPRDILSLSRRSRKYSNGAVVAWYALGIKNLHAVLCKKSSKRMERVIPQMLVIYGIITKCFQHIQEIS